MSITIVDLSVGTTITPNDAAEILAAATKAGVSALRILDGEPGHTADPSIVASYLAGRPAARESDLGWILEASTTHNAPTNLARRSNSFDRAVAGRAGLALRSGQGDEVTDPVAPKPQTPAAARWEEYATVLKGLWRSFPAEALVGDQEGDLFADNTLIKPIDFEGDYYQVAGPLDGPESPQGGPLLVVDDIETLGWDVAARHAEVIVVDPTAAKTAHQDLASALERAGRDRGSVALILRLDVTDPAQIVARVPALLSHYHADGVELVVAGGKADVLALIAELGSRADRGSTLRASFALPQPV